jgi:hypothetical protein
MKNILQQNKQNLRPPRHPFIKIEVLEAPINPTWAWAAYWISWVDAVGLSSAFSCMFLSLLGN